MLATRNLESSDFIMYIAYKIILITDHTVVPYLYISVTQKSEVEIEIRCGTVRHCLFCVTDLYQLHYSCIGVFFHTFLHISLLNTGTFDLIMILTAQEMVYVLVFWYFYFLLSHVHDLVLFYM